MKLKTIILTLVCSVSLLAMETDERPHTRYIFSTQISVQASEGIDDRYSRFYHARNNLIERLESNNVAELEFCHLPRGGETYGYDIILKENDSENKFKRFIFIHATYAFRSKLFHLLPRECDVYGNPNPVCVASCWKYIDTIFKYNRDAFQTKEEKKIFNTVTKRGIERYFVRLGAVINQDNSFSFYNIFQSSEEEVQGLNLLRKIQLILNV
jgi:hypothetical protein